MRLLASAGTTVTCEGRSEVTSAPRRWVSAHDVPAAHVDLEGAVGVGAAERAPVQDAQALGHLISRGRDDVVVGAEGAQGEVQVRPVCGEAGQLVAEEVLVATGDREADSVGHPPEIAESTASTGPVVAFASTLAWPVAP